MSRRPVLVLIVASFAACDRATVIETEATPSLAVDGGPASDAVWQEPVTPSAACPSLPTWSDCHVCCFAANRGATELIWESFRACACRVEASARPCQEACTADYCAVDFPFSRASRACRVCLGDHFDGALHACLEIVSDSCLNDRVCAAAFHCEEVCPPLAPGEDEEAADDRLVDAGLTR